MYHTPHHALLSSAVAGPANICIHPARFPLLESEGEKSVRIQIGFVFQGPRCRQVHTTTQFPWQSHSTHSGSICRGYEVNNTSRTNIWRDRQQENLTPPFLSTGEMVPLPLHLTTLLCSKVEPNPCTSDIHRYAPRLSPAIQTTGAFTAASILSPKNHPFEIPLRSVVVTVHILI